jgi:hypothetical protein
MKMKCKLILAFVPILLLFLIGAANATFTRAQLINDGGTVVNAYYISSSAKAYADDVGTNTGNDFKLRAYYNVSGENASVWVTFVYKVGDSFTIIADGATSGTYLEQLGTEQTSGSIYYADSPVSLNFRNSYAIFPGYIYAVISDNNTVELTDTFISINSTDGYLIGSYSTSGVASTYDQTTGMVSLTVNGVTGQPNSFNILSEHASDQFLMVGICTDSYGVTCSDDNATAPNVANSLNTSILNPPVTSAVNYRYYVINGMGTQFCIGPNMNVTIKTNNSSPNDGDAVLLTATVGNPGNVDVDSEFNVRFYDGTTLLDTQTISTLNSGSSTDKTYVWNTKWQTGSHTMWAKIDTTDTIKECNEDNNNASVAVDVAVTYSAIVYINDTASTNFPMVGRPYNVTVNVTDSTNASVNDAVIRIVEKNGISAFAPIQAWQEGSTNKSVISYSIAEVRTNSSGLVSFALIPTGNKLLDVEPYIATYYTGNYSLYLEIYVSGSLKNTISLTVGELTASEPNGQVNVLNNDIVDYVKDVVYDIYAKIKGWLNYS